ncbi:hypothetical protein niasHT_009387 [Heterodera trifolii]|uniref:Uncharacterized protein n=1 Tax=Heterodera trifolii TaxID=157864 RepID=A0ABD2M6R6_9BILA
MMDKGRMKCRIRHKRTPSDDKESNEARKLTAKARQLNQWEENTTKMRGSTTERRGEGMGQTEPTAECAGNRIPQIPTTPAPFHPPKTAWAV